jgi:hypothetical protein
VIHGSAQLSLSGFTVAVLYLVNDAKHGITCRTGKGVHRPDIPAVAQVGRALRKADQPHDVVVFPAMRIVRIREWKATLAPPWLHDYEFQLNAEQSCVVGYKQLRRNAFAGHDQQAGSKLTRVNVLNRYLGYKASKYETKWVPSRRKTFEKPG